MFCCLFVIKLGRVNADNREAVFYICSRYLRLVMQAVNTAVGPEVQNHDSAFAAE